MFDCIIIGTGAAGVSAALTLNALKKQFIMIGDPRLSRKVRTAEKIKNYPGLSEVSGEELARAFGSQLEEQGIEIRDLKVSGVYPAEDGYSVMCGGEVFQARTVIIATGVEAVKPVEGETELLGRGVSYCAVCDGFLYKDKTIAVYTEGEEERQEVQLLAQYAKAIHLFSPSQGYLERVGTRIDKIKGGMRAECVVCGDKEYKVDGVFILKDAVAADSLVHGLKCEGGAVVVERSQATNLPGVFAAGDCTGKPYQYAKAVGEGNVAAYSVAAYLKK